MDATTPHFVMDNLIYQEKSNYQKIGDFHLSYTTDCPCDTCEEREQCKVEAKACNRFIFWCQNHNKPTKKAASAAKKPRREAYKKLFGGKEQCTSSNQISI